MSILAPIDRFMAKVEKTEACWLWVGCVHPGGYGKFFVRKVQSRTILVYAHRWSYEHFIGPIPDGLEVDHLCRVRHCVNPDHLEPVTKAENVARVPKSAYGNRRGCFEVVCKRGHPRSEDNLTPDRHCRICARRFKQKSRARNVAACSSCYRFLGLRVTGVIRKHSTTGDAGGDICPGSGQPPKMEEAVA